MIGNDGAPPEPADDGDDDDVGYGKPPKRYRFGQPGVKGNRRGRPQGSSTKDVFRRIANEKMPIRIGQTTKTVTSTEAIMMRIRHLALEGNLAAVREYRIWLQIFGVADKPSEERDLPLPLPTVFVPVDPGQIDDKGERIGPKPDISALAEPEIRRQEEEIRKRYGNRKKR